MGRPKRLYPLGKYRLRTPKEVDKDKAYPVELEYTWNRQIIRKTTNVFVKVADWNQNGNQGRGEIRASYGGEFKRLNQLLLARVERIDSQLAEYNEKHPNQITADVVSGFLADKPLARRDQGKDFVEFTLERLSSDYSRNRIGRSRYENGKSCMNIFQTFLRATKQGTYRSDAIYVGDMTPELLDSYIVWRKEIKQNSDATINHALTPILKACAYASEMSMIDPAVNARIQDMRIVTKVSLSEEEVEFDGKSLAKEQVSALLEYYKTCQEPRRKEFLEMFFFAFHACRQYVAEEYQEAFFKFVDLKTLPERMKNEETLVLEYRMKDGDWHRLRFVEKKRDENGVLTHVLCLIRSISDTKKWEHELMYQVEEARKAAALKARFLSNMSHDIRTPMNGIIGTLNLANRYPDDLEVQRKCREQIMTSSKYLVSIVNDILDMNKLESGGVVEQEIPFNLAGNPIYVERLLTNISDNAVKFTGPGGSVRVWCAEKYADEERVVYEFGCADTGIGMSETFLEHAFEPFTQENETSRSRYEGTGLGLAIAKKIVDRLDGDIAIESKKGVGTTVTMTLPFKIGEPVEKEKNVNYEEIPVEGLRALLAEDNELNMEITKFMLEDYGIHVECAADGEEAVQKFKNLSWDITM